MIGHLRGTIIAQDMTTLTLEVTGTGLSFDVLVSEVTRGMILPENEISLWIHHHITEVSELLFGFITLDERSLFRNLMKVNGIGGKTALNILGLGQETILKAIELEDDSILASVSGIGKKTAQKIIVDLKGSIDLSKKKTSPTPQTDTKLVSSLVQMGYDKSLVEEIIRDIDIGLSLEQKTIIAIKQLSQR